MLLSVIDVYGLGKRDFTYLVDSGFVNGGFPLAVKNDLFNIPVRALCGFMDLLCRNGVIASVCNDAVFV